MNHPQAKLDEKKKRVIVKALALNFDVSQLKQAIDGCKNIPFNMGQNERNQIYDGIALILRDAEQIERFIAAADKPTVGVSSSVSSDLMSGVI